MNDARFFDLAMKAIARQSSDAERAELDAVLARQPERRAELERLRAEARIAQEALSLADATAATAGEFPAYARGRLQTKVRQTLGSGRPGAKELDRRLAWGWRWWLGLAAAAAVVALVLTLPSATPGVRVQLALLDPAGTTRGGDTNDAALLTGTWGGAKLDAFSDPLTLREWERAWPPADRTTVAKIIYERSAGELRVIGRSPHGSFTNTFAVQADLRAALAQAKAYLDRQIRR